MLGGICIDVVGVNAVGRRSGRAPAVVVDACAGQIGSSNKSSSDTGIPPSPPLASSSDWKYSLASGATPANELFDAEPSASTEPATWVPWPWGSDELFGRPSATTSISRP